MKTFKEYITEVAAITNIKKNSRSFARSVLPNEGNPMNLDDAERIGTINGHHIYKHHDRWTGQTTYAAHDPRTGRATVAVSGHHRNGVLSGLNVGASAHNKVPAHDLYHHLLHHDHVKALVASSQSPGGRKVWEKLAKKKGIGIHGWDPKEEKPVNVKFGEDDTHEEPAKTDKKYNELNPDPSVRNLQLVAHKQ